MSNVEKTRATDAMGVSVYRGGAVSEQALLSGMYEAECRGKDGSIKWTDRIENLVVTVGKNLALDTFLASTAYTVVGPFMGLISSVGYSSIVAADTMASHAGWTEAGSSLANAPYYTVPRKTAAWNAASAGAKALSAALSFAITSSGTVKGAFMVFGAGAVSTIADTNGTLLSAGLFSGGDRSVLSGDTLNVSYTLSL